MAQTTFYAKVETVNETTYETNTLRVLGDDKEGYTLRIDENAVIQPNAVYRFTCEPVVFKDKDQLQVMEYASIDDCDIPLKKRQELMELFYEFAPVDAEATQELVESYLARIQNPILKQIVDIMYDQRKQSFYLYPAATKFHHAYIGGLSYHTATMMRLIDGFIAVYPFLNQDLLIAGILLHDICKVDELSDYAGPEYTKEGRLVGHITMAVKDIEVVADKIGARGSEEVLLLQHMVLSHHYYGNYGSPKKTNIPEALILHFIDNIDSKMTVLQETLDQVAPGEFTSPIPVLDREKYYKSKLKK